MENPVVGNILDTVRQINEIARKARSGEPTAEDYLKTISSDPVGKWFAELLRERNDELEKEKQRVDRLSGALRAWYAARSSSLSGESATEAERSLANLLQVMKIVEH